MGKVSQNMNREKRLAIMMREAVGFCLPPSFSIMSNSGFVLKWRLGCANTTDRYIEMHNGPVGLSRLYMVFPTTKF